MWLLGAAEHDASAVDGTLVEFFVDAEQLVVLCDAV